jgi:pimeloyl-ACP methyl ester carboxylesterase
MVAEDSGYVTVAGHALEYACFGGAPAARTLVLLHEGLGCVALWRDFPLRLSRHTGLPVLAYSRHGHGRSDVLTQARSTRFMHEEAAGPLPALLGHFGIREPLLVGHSDGASIALLNAALHARAARAPFAPRAVVAMAPHLFVEALSLASIASIARRFPDSDLPARMGRYHVDAARTFHGWADAWLDPAFADWNIEADVAQIGCPVLAIQGVDDEYGTLEQIRRIAHLHRDTRLLELPQCGHSPQTDQPQRVLEAIGAFVTEVAARA